MSSEILTLEGLQKQYEQAIEGLTPTQVEAIEGGNQDMVRLFPRMRQARILWERFQQQSARLVEAQERRSPILFRP